MERGHPEVTVGVFVLNRDGEVLLLRSKKWNGNYTVPTGHVEYGEKAEEAVAREVLEETGLVVEDVGFVGVLERVLEKGEFHRAGHFVCLNYHCNVQSESVQLNEEAEGFTWVAPEKILEMDGVDSTTQQTAALYCERYGGLGGVEVPSGTYQHYKGDRYEVLGVGRHSETLGQFVVYRALYEHPDYGENALWVRPAKMFIETVDIDGKTRPRFAKVV